MKSKEAIDHLDPQRWAETPAEERLHLLEQVRENLKRYGDELAASDTKMKNDLLGEELYSDPTSKIATVVPMANTIAAAIELYEGLVHGEMPKPLEVTKVADGLYDIKVFPSSAKDRLMYGDRTEVLRVKGEPTQVNPMEKPAGIIAVLGAGNYSSSLEMLKAIFFENCAVVHKAPPSERRDRPGVGEDHATAGRSRRAQLRRPRPGSRTDRRPTAHEDLLHRWHRYGPGDHEGNRYPAGQRVRRQQPLSDRAWRPAVDRQGDDPPSPADRHHLQAQRRRGLRSGPDHRDLQALVAARGLPGSAQESDRRGYPRSRHLLPGLRQSDRKGSATPIRTPRLSSPRAASTSAPTSSS